MSILPNFSGTETGNDQNSDVEAYLKELGTSDRLPDRIELLGHFKPALRAYAHLLENNFKNGNIPVLTKQLVLLSIVNATGSKFSQPFIDLICQVTGVQDDMLKALSEDLANLSDDLTGSVVKFGVKCAMNRKHVNEADCKRLIEQGLNHSDIMEIISLAAFANYTITLADILK